MPPPPPFSSTSPPHSVSCSALGKHHEALRCYEKLGNSLDLQAAFSQALALFRAHLNKEASLGTNSSFHTPFFHPSTLPSLPLPSFYPSFSSSLSLPFLLFLYPPSTLSLSFLLFLPAYQGLLEMSATEEKPTVLLAMAMTAFAGKDLNEAKSFLFKV